MLDFKKLIEEDVTETFLNVDEFAEWHTINGIRMAVVIDDNAMTEHSGHWEGGAKQNFDSGIYNSSKKIYVKASDFGARPKIGNPLTLDEKNLFYIQAFSEEDGVYIITVDRKRQ
jgi:hypothetical protein